MHVYRATATATAFTGLLAVTTAVSGLNNHNNSAIYKSLYSLHSNSTPVFHNVSGQSANPLVRVLHGSTKDTRSLVKRDNWELPVGTCAPGIPCVNGACCSKEGVCGFSPDECGTDTCISNCDAKAECGQYALSESATCPLNVCCSEYGFCGTTEDFCGTGCQKGYGGCGDVEKPSCGGQSMSRTIGYYEGWASTRSCDRRLPSDIDLAPLTHLNFAFAFFHPTTFEMMPMSAGDEALYPEFTGLKSKKPSLKTWIAVGGWSFNDATNVPNTQTAFSDMASSPENRQTFINSLRHFMQTWGFDGVDLDWEYPGADDRGGTAEDTKNFVHLLHEMKNAFNGAYGISVTLPASYWYLRWFDLQGMQENLDFFNIMTYDIHGVWDASNQHTGPYVLPHTNITEIKLGLDLLWRNDVDPSQVNFGLGWYGRSFTLQDPSCNHPGCIFSYGGKPGECTKSSGTLSNSEIQQIITDHNLTPTLDAEAAVKWISWDTDQWVSYDDGETIQMKMEEANKLCLGGVLIWAVDLDDSSYTSSNNLLGVGTANGVSPTDAETFRNQKEAADRAASIANTCYWTFCGGSCEKGYSSQAYAKGQVPNIHGDESCTDDTVRTLCCAPGTTMGTCSWHGWNGVGMACATEYCPSGKEMIAMNTNSYIDDPDSHVNSNLTCTGGAQSYCCSGFVPSQIANTDGISLLGDYRVVEQDKQELSARLMPFGVTAKEAACTSAVTASLLGSLGEVGLMLQAILGIVAALRCAKPENEETEKGSEPHSFQDDVVNRLGKGAAGIGQQKPKDEPKQNVPNKTSSKYGRYTPIRYKKGQKDCEVTYTCKYGEGFDEVCDNMRWAIEKGLGDERVYHKSPNGRAPREGTYVPGWYADRDPVFRQNAVRPPWWPTGDLPRCNIEEFPFASLEEAEGYQVIRFLSQKVNSKHSKDWSNWLNAIFAPCKALRKQQGISPPEPPITMTWSPFEEGDNRIKANEEPPHNAAPHFIEAYGFNSQGDVECLPTYSYAAGNGESVTKTLTDYGFRAHPQDPMFQAPYKYPFNDYSGNFPPSADRPNEINHVDWLKIKRDITLDVLNQDLPLFAIQEVEDLEEAFRRTLSTEAMPTDAADFSVPIGTDSAGSGTGSSWLSGTRHHMPAETGVSEVELEDSAGDSHMMRRRRQHLQEHQRGHGHGHH